MISKTEAKRFLKISLPVIGSLVVASCATNTAPTPTIDEIRASLPPPKITPSNTILYTHGEPIETSVLSENLCASGALITTINPPGPMTEWVREEWLDVTSPKTKLRVSQFPKANENYQVTMSGFNCIDYRGQMVNTDTVMAQVNVIYDTLPPNAEIMETIIDQGRLILKLKATDNLAGPQQELIEYLVDKPAVGRNYVPVYLCDRANNCITQDLYANYEPFAQVIRMNQASIDPFSGRMVIAGSINDPQNNIALEQTSVEVKQSRFADMPFDLGMGQLDCEEPRFQGYDFQMTCTPRGPNGRSIVTITVKDRLGNKYTQPFEAQVPPFPPERQQIFYTILGLSLLGSTGLATKIRADKIKRERRAAVANAVLKKNRRGVEQSLKNLVKRDRKANERTLEEYDHLMAIEEMVRRGLLVDALASIAKTYSQKNIFLTEASNKVVAKIVRQISQVTQVRDWRLLEQPEYKSLINFLGHAYTNQKDYGFLWEAIYRSGPSAENIIGSMALHLINNSRGNEKSIRALGLYNPENLRRQIPLLSQWGDFAGLLNFINNLPDVEQAKRAEIRLVLDEAQQTAYKGISDRLGSLYGISRTADLEEGLQAMRARVIRSKFYPDYQVGLENGIRYLERKLHLLETIDRKVGSVIDLASKHSVTTDTALIKYLNGDIMGILKDRDILDLLLKREDKEVDTFVTGCIVVNIVPLSYFVGAGEIKFVGDALRVGLLPSPKFVNVPYHEEHKLSKTYKDQLFTAFLKLIYTRLTQEFCFPEKHHRMEGEKFTYDKWIPLYDSAIYGKNEIAFINDLLKVYGMDYYKATHDNMLNWYLKKARLVAR